VGTPCTVHGDCAGLAASKCPMRIDPRLPNWCSMLCSPGDDCGEGAFCWYRPSLVEKGLVGSCAPLMCRAEEEPGECDPDAAVQGQDTNNGDATGSSEDDATP
jgi:hypothetical protein